MRKFFCSFLFIFFLTFSAYAVPIAILDSGVNCQDPKLSRKIVKVENTPIGKYLATVLEELYTKFSDGENRDLAEEISGILDIFKKSCLTKEQASKNSHGTIVAKIASENAPEISILPIKISLVSDTLAAVTLANYAGVKIVNLSYGPKGVNRYSDYMKKLREVFEKFPDMLFVLAAGNDGVNVANLQGEDSLNLSNVTVVAATDENDQIEMYSQYGPNHVDIAALGKFSQESNKLERNGTSFAAPRVSRLSAKIKHIKPELSTSQIKEIVCSTVEKTNELEEDTRYGGFIDEEAAIKMALETKGEKKVEAKKNRGLPFSHIFGKEALFFAARKGHLKMAKMLIEMQVDVNSTFEHGYAPLHAAAKNGHFEVAKLLINNKAKVDKQDNFGNTPLIIASSLGHENLVKLLIKSKADVNKANGDGVTPLYASAENGKVEIAEILLKNGALVDKATKNETTPLLISVNGRQLDMAKLLIKNKAKLNLTNKSGIAPLHIAAEKGDVEMAMLLLADPKKIKIDKVDSCGLTSLHKAALWGREKMVFILINSDANSNITDNSYGMTPIHIAAEKGYLGIVKILIKKSKKNKKTKDGLTALQIAKHKKHKKIIEFLTK